MDSIFTFGMSGGGAQSALVGATGDSELYTPYLEAIGAAMKDASGAAISDAVAAPCAGAPSPVWTMPTRPTNGTWASSPPADTRADTSFGSALSKDLAAAYADYINALKLKNGDTGADSLESPTASIRRAPTTTILSVVNLPE
jgi:hypothetical protein